MIELFLKKEDCSGCTACMNSCPKGAIEMTQDSEGFLYPNIKRDLCVNCGKCLLVCPFKDNFLIKDILPYPFVYAAKHKFDQIRMTSTSGGMFTAISDYILSKNGTVYGAGFDENLNVFHSKAITKEERDKFKGSKYVQSDLKQVFKEVKEDLKQDKYVLFTGTPCQTAGLYNFLQDTEKGKLFLCDLVCHGTPSSLIWRDYCDFLEKKHHNKLVFYNFRAKWRGIHVYAKFSNGKSLYNTKDLLIYTLLFYSLNAHRPSCHNCKFTNFHRPSDITIADSWGMEKSLPEFMDEKGVSLLLINTQKGKDLFEEIKEHLDFRESNTTDCMQRDLQFTNPIAKNRQKFWDDYNKNGFLYIAKKYAKYGIINNITRKIKEFIKFVLRYK